MKPFKIPKQFDLAGNTFKVIVKEGMSKGGAHGQTHFDSAEIWLDKTMKPEDLKGITYHHELVHAILMTLGRSELNNDEAFVDAFGNLLWQHYKTLKY